MLGIIVNDVETGAMSGAFSQHGHYAYGYRKYGYGYGYGYGYRPNASAKKSEEAAKTVTDEE